jgi:hypothetical protein
MLVAEDANLDRRILNALLNLRVVSTIDGTVIGRIQFSDLNAVLQLDAISGSGASGASNVSIVDFVSEKDNYLQCLTGDAETIYVAKPYLLQRQTYDGKTRTLPDGTHVWAWVSNSNGTTTYSVRTDSTTDPATFALIAKRSVIWPPYGYYGAAGQASLTVASGVTTPFTDPDDNPITYVDLNTDARAWFTQEEICYEGVAAFEIYPTPAFSISI